uniref:Uncharacterized protein n=1 Tax=Schizaphis graminum TaxID=13262 RepID=A0A2S2P6C0_SCHGA
MNTAFTFHFFYADHTFIKTFVQIQIFQKYTHNHYKLICFCPFHFLQIPLLKNKKNVDRHNIAPASTNKHKYVVNWMNCPLFKNKTIRILKYSKIINIKFPRVIK